MLDLTLYATTNHTVDGFLLVEDDSGACAVLDVLEVGLFALDDDLGFECELLFVLLIFVIDCGLILPLL